MAKSDAERQRAYRERYRAKNLTGVHYVIHREDKAELDRFVKELNGRRAMVVEKPNPQRAEQ